VALLGTLGVALSADGFWQSWKSLQYQGLGCVLDGQSVIFVSCARGAWHWYFGCGWDTL